MSLRTSLDNFSTSVTLPQTEEQGLGPINKLSAELLQNIISRLDQASKQSALMVNSKWKANVIVQLEREKTEVAKLIQFIVSNLDEKKYPEVIEGFNECTKENPINSIYTFHPVYSSLRLKRKCTWFFNVKMHILKQFSRLTEEDLKQLKKAFSQQEMDPYFADMPDLALLFKKPSFVNSVFDKRQNRVPFLEILSEFLQKGYFDEAVEMACSSRFREESCHNVSIALSEAGYLNKAFEVANLIIRTSHDEFYDESDSESVNESVNEPVELTSGLLLKSSALRAITNAFFKMKKDWKKALEMAFVVACKIPNISFASETYQKDEIMRDIATAFGEEKNWDKAIEAAQMIVDHCKRDGTLYMIAIRALANGYLDEAIEAINAIRPNTFHKAKALVELMRFYWKKGRVDEAAQVAITIPYEHINSYSILDILKGITEALQKKRDLKMADQITSKMSMLLKKP